MHPPSNASSIAIPTYNSIPLSYVSNAISLKYKPSGTTNVVKRKRRAGRLEDLPRHHAGEQPVVLRGLARDSRGSGTKTGNCIARFTFGARRRSSLTAGHNIFWNAASTLFGASGCLLREPLGIRRRPSLRFEGRNGHIPTPPLGCVHKARLRT